MKAIRIPAEDLKKIEAAFKKPFSAEDHLWLFGSRVNPEKKGGDIDFYIETLEADTSIALHKKMAFVSELWESLGEQKIDIVLNLKQTQHSLPIYQIAKESGIQLL